MARRTSRAEEKEATRRGILAAAKEVLRERGAAAMTSRAVAERAGVAVGTVFLHFASTTKLFEALLDEQLGAALPRAIATVKARGLVPRLCHVARVLFESYDAEPALSRLYLANTLFSEGEVTVDPRLGELEAWVATEVEGATAAGAIEPIEPHLAFLWFFSLYFSLLVAGLRGHLRREQQLALLKAGLTRLFTRRSCTS